MRIIAIVIVLCYHTGMMRFYQTVFEFVPYPNGSFSWHHLWFIAYLWVYSLVGLPMFFAAPPHIFDQDAQTLACRHQPRRNRRRVSLTSTSHS